MRHDEKMCPYCAEVVKTAAIRCKHCHADLSVSSPTSALGVADLMSSPREPTIHATKAAPISETSEVFSEGEVADILSHLVEKSLVVFDEATGRYRLLESVRQYARDRLNDTGGDAEEAQRVRHCGYFLALAEQSWEKRYTAEASVVMNALEQEHDNCLAVLDFCSTTSDPDAHLLFASALGWLWHVRGYYREGRARLASALSRPDAQGITAPRAQALNTAGILAVHQNDPQAARPLLKQSVEAWRALGDKSRLAVALSNLGVLERQELHYDYSKAFFDESLALVRECGDLARVALVLGNLGLLAKMQNDFTHARPLLEESVDICRETGNLYVMESAIGHLAEVAMKQGDFKSARAQFQEALAMQATSHNEMSFIDVLEAVAEFVSIFRCSRDAVRLFAAAAAERDRSGVHVVPGERADYDRREQLLRAALDEKSFGEEWAAGFALTSEAALKRAISLTLEDPSQSAEAIAPALC